MTRKAVKSKSRKRWNQTELKLAHGRLPAREVARRTGRSVQSVNSKRAELHAAGTRSKKRTRAASAPFPPVSPDLLPAAASVNGHLEVVATGDIKAAVLQVLDAQLEEIAGDIESLDEEAERIVREIEELDQRYIELKDKRDAVADGKPTVKIEL